MVLVHDFPGHAFPAQLSRLLARRGHRVTHCWCAGVTSARGRLEPDAGDPRSLRFLALAKGRTFDRYSLVRRPFQEVGFGGLVGEIVRRERPDVVISANAPLLTQHRILAASTHIRAGFVYWLQDLLGLGTSMELQRRFGWPGRVTGEALARLETHLLSRSDQIVAIADDYVDALATDGVAAERITVIPNWSPLDELPERPRDNAWAREHGLTDRLTYLYAGTLGLKHDPSLLTDLAAALGDDACVVVVSEGLGADWLRDRIERRSLRNLLVLDYQPYDRLPDVLAAGDVLLALLQPGAGAFSVPSKVLTYHCAGRPLLCAIPQANLAARIVQQERSGLVVDPDDRDGFVAAAQRLREDEKLRHAMGTRARRYAESAFDLERVTDDFEQVMDAAVRQRRST